MDNNNWDFTNGYHEIEDEEFYVRPDRTEGFTLIEARHINQLRLRIRNGECIDTEAALKLVRRSMSVLGKVDFEPY